MTHGCPGPESQPYPTFDDNPARRGLLPESPMTEAELAAAAELDVWGPRGPSASYAEWVVEGRAARTGGRAVTHECPGPGCTEQVAPDRLMCPACWSQVPKPVRRAVYIAWNRGTGAGSPAHEAAMRAAIAAVSRAA